MKKRFISGLTAFAMAVSMVGLPAVNDLGLHFDIVASAETVDSGTCGTNLTWTLDSNGILTISGNGMMTNWDDGYYTPWYKNRTSIESVVIHDGVSNIGNCAFHGVSSIKSIIIPNSIKIINKKAFSGCSGITSVKIPDSVIRIDKNAFDECTQLDSLIIGNGVTDIGDYAFYKCNSLKNITLGNSIQTIGELSFYGCSSLESISIGNSVTKIGNSAFGSCTALENIEIANSVTMIGVDAFYGTEWIRKKRLESPFVIVNGILIDGQECKGDIVIPYGVKSINSCAFHGNEALKNVTLPNSVTTICANAFSDSSLRSIDIPEGVISIQSEAFYECKRMFEVTIPASVTYIGNLAFGFYYDFRRENVNQRYGLTIFCYPETAAEKYAIDNGIKYVNIYENEPINSNEILWGNELSDGTFSGQDNLSFENSDKYFSDTKGYRLDGEYYKKLVLDTNMDETVRESIKKRMSASWGGSCYGMSSVVSLIKTGHLTPSYWSDDSNAEHATDLPAPIDNNKVNNLIQFYQIINSLPDVEKTHKKDFEKLHLTSNENSNGDDYSIINNKIMLKEVVDEISKVKIGGYPVVLSYFYYANTDTQIKYEDSDGPLTRIRKFFTSDYWYCKENDKIYSFIEEDILLNPTNNEVSINMDNSKAYYNISLSDMTNGISLSINGNTIHLTKVHGGGHAVLGYDIVSGEYTAENNKTYKYRISIYDPNDPDACNTTEKAKYTYMYISEDYSDWYYHHTNGSVIKNSIGQPIMFIGGCESTLEEIDPINPETGENRIKLTSYEDNFISDNQGTVAEIVSASRQTTVVSAFSGHGSLPITVLPSTGDTVEGNTNPYRTIFLPKNDNTSYTLTPKMDRLDADIIFSNYMLSVNAENVDTATYESTGRVSAKLNGGKYTIAATSNQGHGSLPWYTLKATGSEANEVSLMITDDGLLLEGDNLNDVEVKANNDNTTVDLLINTNQQSVLLNDIDDNTIGAFIDVDQNGTYETKMSDSDGNFYNDPCNNTNHTVGNTIIENEISATCTTDGSYDEVTYCTVCGKEMSRETKNVEKFGHKWSKWTVTKEATETEQGEKKRTCFRCGEEETETIDYKPLVDISKAKIKLSTNKVEYTGKMIAPDVKVTYLGRKLNEGTDYELSYKDSLYPGKATVTITGIGKYSGSVEKNYYITPAKVVITSLTSDEEGKMTVNWINDGMADGYEILTWSTRRCGYSSTVSKFVVDADKSTATLSDLDAGNRYYVKIRAYKVIDGERVYNKYGNAKSVKIKEPVWKFDFGFGYTPYGYYPYGYNPYGYNPYGYGYSYPGYTGYYPYPSVYQYPAPRPYHAHYQYPTPRPYPVYTYGGYTMNPYFFYRY